jgi:predicted amidohydrolase
MASKHTSDLDYELKLVQALCWSRAFETETVFIHVNPGGLRDEGFMGGSGVWAPLKGKIGGYAREEVGLQFVDIDLKALEVSRALLDSSVTSTDVLGWARTLQDQGRRRPSLGRC